MDSSTKTTKHGLAIELAHSNSFTHLESRGSQWVLDGFDEKNLVRKIDRRILPLLFLIYFVQFMDKIILNVCLLPPLRP
jgi:hypothetical protein